MVDGSHPNGGCHALIARKGAPIVGFTDTLRKLANFLDGGPSKRSPDEIRRTNNGKRIKAKTAIALNSQRAKRAEEKLAKEVADAETKAQALADAGKDVDAKDELVRWKRKKGLLIEKRNQSLLLDMLNDNLDDDTIDDTMIYLSDYFNGQQVGVVQYAGIDPTRLVAELQDRRQTQAAMLGGLLDMPSTEPMKVSDDEVDAKFAEVMAKAATRKAATAMSKSDPLRESGDLSHLLTDTRSIIDRVKNQGV